MTCPHPLFLFQPQFGFFSYGRTSYILYTWSSSLYAETVFRRRAHTSFQLQFEHVAAEFECSRNVHTSKCMAILC